MCQAGGLGVLPQKIICFNGVKSLNSRQEKYENALSYKQWKLDSFHNLDKGNIEKYIVRSILNIELISVYTCNTGERSEPEKKKIIIG